LLLYTHLQISEGHMERGLNVGYFDLRKTSAEHLSETACALLQHWLDSNKVFIQSGREKSFMEGE
jgi:hypothetical protein